MFLRRGVSFRLKCKRCLNNIQIQVPGESTDCTSHLSQWYHCANNKGLPDSILAQAWQTSKCISFIFHHRSQVLASSKPMIECNGEEKENICNGTNKPNSNNTQSDADEDSSYSEQDDEQDSDYA